jgi:hypothetical protein
MSCLIGGNRYVSCSNTRGIGQNADLSSKRALSTSPLIERLHMYPTSSSQFITTNSTNTHRLDLTKVVHWIASRNNEGIFDF